MTKRMLLVSTLALLVGAGRGLAQDDFNPERYLMRQKELPAPYRVHDEERRFPAFDWNDNHWYRAGANPEGMTDKDFDYVFIHEEIWKGNNTSIQVEGAVFKNPLVAELRLKDLKTNSPAGSLKAVDLGGVTGLYCTTDDGLFPKYYVQIKNLFGYVYGGQRDYEETLTIAKLWVDKLLGRSTDHTVKPEPPEPPAKDLPDLHVEAAGMVLALQGDNTLLEYEPAADKQSVAVQIQNRSQKTDADNVFLQLYVASPAGSTPKAVGNQVALGRLAAGQSKTPCVTWDMGGQNQVDVELWAKVYVPNADDAKPEDNQAHLKCSIRYASNGQRAFSWANDTYSFANFGYQGRETEEMVEGVVATILGNLQQAPDSTKVWQKLTFAATYERMAQYLEKSQKAGAGGHCYGMSATAGLYFEGAAAPPLGKTTPALTLEEASTNINLYHRAQMVPLLQALSSKTDYREREFSPRNCYNWVRNALDASRLSPIIEFFGRDPGDKTIIIGHAVLAYKLIEVEGRDPVIYVYDSNYPASKVKAPRPMPQIVLRLGANTWANPPYMGYDWAVAQWICAHRVAREIPLDMVNAIGPQLKAMAYAAVGALNEGKLLMAVLRCPADVCFTDGQGRRTGMVGGKLVNEIPGAEPGAVGEVEVYLLPAGQEYGVTISGTGTGDVALDLLRAPAKDQLAVASFDRVPIRQGGTLTGVLTSGGQVANLKSATQTYPLQWSGSASVAAFQPGAAPPPPPQPATPTPPTVTLPDPTPPTAPQSATRVAVGSAFDGDYEGWIVVNLGQQGPYDAPVGLAAPTYRTAGGNPGGYVCRAAPGPGRFFWQAPNVFLGRRANLYGGSLRYDLKSEGTGQQEEADVVLVGAGLVLLHKQPEPPTAQWRTFVAPLTEQGWRKDALTGPPATAAEFRKALGSLTALRLRGGDHQGAEVSSLDNVSLCRPGG